MYSEYDTVVFNQFHLGYISYNFKQPLYDVIFHYNQE